MSQWHWASVWKVVAAGACVALCLTAVSIWLCMLTASHNMNTEEMGRLFAPYLEPDSACRLKSGRAYHAIGIDEFEVVVGAGSDEPIDDEVTCLLLRCGFPFRWLEGTYVLHTANPGSAADCVEERGAIANIVHASMVRTRVMDAMRHCPRIVPLRPDPIAFAGNVIVWSIVVGLVCAAFQGFRSVTGMAMGSLLPAYVRHANESSVIDGRDGDGSQHRAVIWWTQACLFAALLFVAVGESMRQLAGHELESYSDAMRWIAATLIVVSAVLLLRVRKSRRARWIEQGRCPDCGYPAGASTVCTECGAQR